MPRTDLHARHVQQAVPDCRLHLRRQRMHVRRSQMQQLPGALQHRALLPELRSDGGRRGMPQVGPQLHLQSASVRQRNRHWVLDHTR